MNFKAELIRYSKLLEEKSFVNALEGNLSIIDRETGNIYITPSGKRKLFLEEEMIAVVDPDGNQIDGLFKHSKEIILHKIAYDLRPDTTAAIHCHCTYLTAYSFLNKPIINNSDIGFVSCFKEIPVMPFGMPASAEIAKGLETYILKSNIVLLGNHGVLCVDKNMEECAKMLEAAESMVKTFTIASQIGEVKQLPIEVLKKF